MSAGQSATPGAPAAFDAVTLDGYGTLLTIRDPIDHLDRELRSRGVELTPSVIESGFAAEGAYYTEAKVSARDAESLSALRLECARVFLQTVDAELDPADFASALVYEFDVLPGVPEALARLAAHGFALALVANWDVGLHEHLRAAGLAPHFSTVVVSAELGVAKPDPRPFLHALERLGVEPGRTVHIGDRDTDEEGAAAAGLQYLPAPLEGAVRGWLG
jgi:putative hydrolase of the HAD superfamily